MHSTRQSMPCPEPIRATLGGIQAVEPLTFSSLHQNQPMCAHNSEPLTGE